MHSPSQIRSSFKSGKYNHSYIPFFQPKFTINQPHDIYEQEADSMADKVMRMPSNKTENTFFKPANISSIQRKCAHCEEEEKVQMKSESIVNAGMEATSIVHDVINSGGQPLDAGTRNFFEPRFGHDFSNVKIHTGSQASASSRSINAHAYTSGNNIVFNEGKYAPQTDDGRRLLAHELTHTIQQFGDRSTHIQRETKHCYKGAKEASGEVVNQPELPHVHYVIWGTFKTGQTNREFVEATFKKWIQWRFGNLSPQQMKEMFDFGLSELRTGNSIPDECQHPIIIVDYVMGRLRKMSGEIEREQKGKDTQPLDSVKGNDSQKIDDTAVATIGLADATKKTKDLEHTPSSKIESDKTILSDPVLAKRFMLLLEHYGGRAPQSGDDLMVADGLTTEELDKLIGKNRRQNAVLGFFTQGYKEFKQAEGKNTDAFFTLSETILEQLFRGNPTASHNGLKIGKPTIALTSNGTNETSILGIISRSDGMLLYDDQGIPLPGISGIGMRDKGYIGSRLREDNAFMINIANIEDPGLRIFLNTLRQTFTDPTVMTVQAADIYMDNIERVNNEVAKKMPAELKEKFESALIPFLGFLAGHGLSTLLMRMPNPVAVGVGVSLKAALTVAGYVMDIEFADEALNNLLSAARSLIKVQCNEKGELSSLSSTYIEEASLPIAKMAADIALTIGMLSLSKILSGAKSGKEKYTIKCTTCRIEPRTVKPEPIPSKEIEGAVDKATTPEVTGGKKPRIDNTSIPTKKRRLLDLEDIPRKAGETMRGALARIRLIIGRKISDIPSVKAAWERARQKTLAKEQLTEKNYSDLYDKTRNAFWKEVRNDPAASKEFTDRGFKLDGAETTAARLEGVSAEIPTAETVVSLDHISEKAIGDNWKLALDAENLQFEFAKPNTYREIVQSRHPELRPDK